MAFDWKITAKKWAIELGTLFVITAGTYAVDTMLPDISIGYPEYAGIILLVSPFIVALINYLKHRNDI